MLLDVASDDQFQRYCDKSEQQLYVALAPPMLTAIHLHVRMGSVRAQDYLTQRAEPLLLRHYRKVHADQYRAVGVGLLEAKTLPGGEGLNAFLAEQMMELQRRARRIAFTIAESLGREITRRILALVGEGKSNQVVAREIRKIAPTLSKQRAATIARTETHSSATAAIDATIRSKNLKIAAKEWWTNRDGRERPSHHDAHMQRRTMDEPFEVGGYLLMRPGDDGMGADVGEIANCRCSVLFHSAD